MGFPGHVCASNLSSDVATGIGGWTDGELLRAFREGVSKDGHALFGLMPYGDFRNLSEEDARSIVAYIRTLAPVRNTVRARKLQFPLNVFTQLGPKPLGPEVAAPTPGTPAYGQYLTEMAGCSHCHTPMVKGKPVEGRAFAGGVEWKGPWGRVISRNITPDDETGIGKMTREEFVGRFKSFEHLDVTAQAPAGRNTVMPWRSYAGMTEADLGQIYDYLRTVPKLHNVVNAFPDAK
jgi:mono/diheme cytochrome c family protein